MELTASLYFNILFLISLLSWFVTVGFLSLYFNLSVSEMSQVLVEQQKKLKLSNHDNAGDMLEFYH